MKIVRIRSLGAQATYSPEMRGEQHNYILQSGAIHRNSHAVSYCLMALRCLWLKAHFAPEFWASVMSDCHPDKLVRYMSVARSEYWKPTDITYCGRKPKKPTGSLTFSTLNINDMTVKYTVTDDSVNQGLIGIKGIGDGTAQVFAIKGNWRDIDHFVTHQSDSVPEESELDVLQYTVSDLEKPAKNQRKNKAALERFIKLGAFQTLPGHENSRALWQWYQYKYCDISSLKKEIKAELLKAEGWTEETIQAERVRQLEAYKAEFPRRKITDALKKKFGNWMPKPDDSREKVMALYPDDFPQKAKLEFQKEFLGYYLDSPLELFVIRGDCSIQDVKQKCLDGAYDAPMEVMVVDQQFLTTKAKNGRNGSDYAKLTVTDGIQRAIIFIWNSELSRQDPETLREGAGIRIRVKYDEMRGTFSMCNNSNIIKLRRRKD